MAMSAASVLAPGDGTAGFLGRIGVRFMVSGAESGGGFSFVEPTSIPKLVQRFDLAFPGVPI